MWCLRGGLGDRPQQDILLVPGEYLVGRLGAEVELDDKSVSRKHAKLTLPQSGAAKSFSLEGLW